MCGCCDVMEMVIVIFGTEGGGGATAGRNVDGETVVALVTVVVLVLALTLVVIL